MQTPHIDETEAEYFPVLRVTREGKGSIETLVTKEFPVTIVLDDQELVTLLGSAQKPDCLAVGFLFSEGLLQDKNEIDGLVVDDVRGIVRVRTKSARAVDADFLFKRLITSGCGRGASFYSVADTESQKIESRLTVSPEEVFNLVNKFQHSSSGYLATHGVHSSSLCSKTGLVVSNEDIGRHNAVDKTLGECVLKSINTSDGILITSGRVSSDILHKVAKRGIPIVVSISVPTNLGVVLSDRLGVTLIGRVRGQKMIVYSHAWRVSL